MNESSIQVSESTVVVDSCASAKGMIEPIQLDRCGQQPTIHLPRLCFCCVMSCGDCSIVSRLVSALSS